MGEEFLIACRLKSGCHWFRNNVFLFLLTLLNPIQLQSPVRFANRWRTILPVWKTLQIFLMTFISLSRRSNKPQMTKTSFWLQRTWFDVFEICQKHSDIWKIDDKGVHQDGLCFSIYSILREETGPQKCQFSLGNPRIRVFY